MSLFVLALVLGATLLGAFLTWLFLRGQKQAAYEAGRSEGTSETARLEERARQLQRQLHDLKERRSEMQDALDAARADKTALAEKNAALRDKLATQKQELEALQEQFATEFENLANKIFEQKSEKFSEQNKSQLTQLLDPLEKKLKHFEEKVQDTYEKGLKERSSLKEQIQHLTTLNQQLSQQADDLVTALEGQSKTQGDWGEMILERILEESGLQKDREYVVQQHFTTENGQQARPDVVVKLPGERHIVIDAKVSITAYRRHLSAEDEDERTAQLKKHVASVRSHINELSSKNYEHLHANRSPDFVLLFIPVEPAFAAALQAQENLYNEAFQQNVVIVSPTTLLTTLATIEHLWKQEYQSQNAQQIAERGGKLYDKFVLFAEALEDVGHRLDQAQDSYSTAMKRLQTGRGNLVRQAEMLRNLGADTSKELSAELTSETP